MQNKSTTLKTGITGKVIGFAIDRQFGEADANERWCQIQIATPENVKFYVKCRMTADEWDKGDALSVERTIGKKVFCVCGIVGVSGNGRILAIANYIDVVDDKGAFDWKAYQSAFDLTYEEEKGEEAEEEGSLFDGVDDEEETEESEG